MGLLSSAVSPLEGKNLLDLLLFGLGLPADLALLAAAFTGVMLRIASGRQIPSQAHGD